MHIEEREQEPLIFCSRAERNRSLQMAAPLINDKAFALLPDWKHRFMDQDGHVVSKSMPDAMKRAAEARDNDIPTRIRQEQDLDLFGKEEGEEGKKNSTAQAHQQQAAA